MKLSKVYQHRGAVYAVVYSTGWPNPVRSEVEICHDKLYRSKAAADAFVKENKKNYVNLRTIQLNLG